MSAKTAILASCRCGSVQLLAQGKPITGAICYCDDCQEAARRIEAIPDAPPVHTSDGGTAYLLYRKDRLRFLKGGQSLKDIRLRENSPTRRVISDCCNSAMFLDFEKGHWMSVYAARFAGDAPPVEMRVQTRFKPKDAELPADLPIYSAFPPKFMAKLVLAKIGMLLHL